MGTLAKLKLRKLEEIIKMKFKKKIKIWFRYVDDIFAVLKRDTDEMKIIEKLSTTDKIKFRIEAEKVIQLNILM